MKEKHHTQKNENPKSALSDGTRAEVVAAL
jgi:hypothetical protein